MGSACQAGTDGPSCQDVRRIANGAVGNGHGVADVEEWREKEEDLPNGHSVPPGAQQGEDQKQEHGRVVRWEKFLPVKTLRVLLVENDDSTRQVVSALLRRCSYEVIPAENGLHAWQHLEDPQNNIDLVLTEVFMPCLSGIGLLSKITSHKICKDVPVIMMSSNDSMGMVFKCLSKGAVDFLVKPLRKNELKNLWQHVWRRCHSSSGSGSESAIHTQKCAEPKSDEYENNSDSNNDDDEDDDDDFSVGLNARDGSDNGSGTQSSWTKRAVEIDSPQPMSPDQLADPPDSTCAQVIHPKSEICSNKWLPTANKRNGKKQKENNDESMGKYLEIGVPRNSSTEYLSSLNDTSVNPIEKRHETHMSQGKSKKKSMAGKDGTNTLTDQNTQTADLISSIARSTEAQQAVRITDASGCPSKMPDGNEKNHDSLSNMASHDHELGLKRLKTNGAATEILDERNILRRSDLSAFTRYHTSVASNQGGARFGESCSPEDESSEAVKTESTCKMKSSSDAAPIKQGSNGSSNNNDMGSSTKNVVAKPPVNRERVMSPSAVKSTQHTSAFHPVQHETSPAKVVGKDTADEGIANGVKVGHPTEVSQSCVHNHHHVHYYLHVMTQQPSIDHGSSDAQCGSSNVFDPPVPAEGHAANYSVNGGISGCHNGSNGQNVSSAAAPNVAIPNMESVNGIMGKNGAGCGHGSGSGSGNDMYQNKCPQREAALNKFRLKRKDRNFSKKVRYQTRKKLAEQRPRVRGQFVRQSGQEDQAGQEAKR